MEEGVSLSLPGNGFPVDSLLEVSVPFSREYGCYGGFNLPPYTVKGSDVYGALTTRGRHTQKGVSPILTLKRDAEAGLFSQASLRGTTSSDGRDSNYFITADANLDAADPVEAGSLFSNGRRGKVFSGVRASKGVNNSDAVIDAVAAGPGVAVIGLIVDPEAISSDFERPVQKGVSPSLAKNGFDDNGSLPSSGSFHRDSEDYITTCAIRVAADHVDASSAVATIGQISDSRASALDLQVTTASSGVRASAVGITANAFNGAADHAGYGVAVSINGPIVDSSPSCSDLLSYALPSSVSNRSDIGIRQEVSILGLGGGVFPLILPLEVGISLDTKPRNGYVDAAGFPSMSGSVSVAANLVNLITTPVKVGKVKVTDTPTRLTSNTFECFAISEVVGTLEVAVDHGPSRYGSPTIPDVSDTSITGVVSTLVVLFLVRFLIALFVGFVLF